MTLPLPEELDSIPFVLAVSASFEERVVMTHLAPYISARGCPQNEDGDEVCDQRPDTGLLYPRS